MVLRRDGTSIVRPVPVSIVLMSPTGLSPGPLLSSRAGLRFARQPSRYTETGSGFNCQVCPGVVPGPLRACGRARCGWRLGAPRSCPRASRSRPEVSLGPSPWLTFVEAKIRMRWFCPCAATRPSKGMAEAGRERGRIPRSPQGRSGVSFCPGGLNSVFPESVVRNSSRRRNARFTSSLWPRAGPRAVAAAQERALGGRAPRRRWGPTRERFSGKPRASFPDKRLIRECNILCDMQTAIL